MKRRSRPSVAMATTMTVALLTGGVALATHDDGNTIHGCISKKGAVRIVDDPSLCMVNESLTEWNIVGPQGPQGPQGPAGPAGATGPEGPQGSPGVVSLARRSNGGVVDGQTTVTANCLAGEVATGGGVVAVDQGTHIFSSSFTVPNDGWSVTALGNNDSIAVHVMCAELGS